LSPLPSVLVKPRSANGPPVVSDRTTSYRRTKGITAICLVFDFSLLVNTID
jgi:hypothetical protein